MKKNRIVVNGFAFADRETAQKAVKEAESIKYVKEKLDMENPRMVLEMYRKLTKEQVFQTPVGLVFLKQLQDYLARRPEFKMEGLEPIQAASLPRPQGQVQPASPKGGQTANPIRPTGTGESHRVQPGRIQDPAGPVQQDASDEFGSEELAEWYEDQIEEEKQKRRTAELKQRRAEGKLKSRRGVLRFSVAVNLFLLIIAIGIAVITLMDDSPNIINYENKIVDKYAEWEQMLEEREEAVKQREQELGL